MSHSIYNTLNAFSSMNKTQRTAFNNWYEDTDTDCECQLAINVGTVSHDEELGLWDSSIVVKTSGIWVRGSAGPSGYGHTFAVKFDFDGNYLKHKVVESSTSSAENFESAMEIFESNIPLFEVSDFDFHIEESFRARFEILCGFELLNSVA
ncbi:hypothetical protein NVP1031O_121 [Vibrio phage 1.031.O._10N.261.46.F8]|nr:hypothetical protein NVP1031O_121 [Vibrio phage 1.031.O._10N.261.46.F8]